MSAGVIIIGAGLAGLTVARTLRAEGFDGIIRLIGDEAAAPYDRTTLSKSVLAGDDAEPPALAPPDWYADAGIDLLTGRRVVAIDATAGLVRLDDGTTLDADHIVLATGAQARVPRIPGIEAERVLLLRTLADVRRLQSAMNSAGRIAIIGGGLIGCEVASTARKLGREVVLLESSDELLQRVLGAGVGAWCRGALEALGVECHLQCVVQGFEHTSQGVTIHCDNKASVHADLVLVCIGAVPDDALAREAGLPCDNGVIVDASGRTAASKVWAVGDVARWPLRDGGTRSLETYLNSQAQAEVVAKSILGNPAGAAQDPISWTEIAGSRIQIAGDFVGPGELITRGNLAAGNALHFRVRDGQVVAAIGVNVPKDFAIAARLASARSAVDPARLADPVVPLRSLMSATRT